MTAKLAALAAAALAAAALAALRTIGAIANELDALNNVDWNQPPPAERH